MSTPAQQPVSGRLMNIGWISETELQYSQWTLVGRRLGAIARCSQWWVGDWVRYGARRYGEQYARAAKLTGYDVHSLRNMAYVASRFPDLSRRRDTLSWSHHAELAAMRVDDQERWLTLAEKERLSVADLRAALRLERRALVSASATRHCRRVCPQCGHEWVDETKNVRSDGAV